MTMTYDPKADAAYIYAAAETAPIHHSVELEDECSGIVLDFRPDGRLAGVEILHASRRLSKEMLGGAQRI